MRILFNAIIMIAFMALLSSCQEDIVTGEDVLIPSEFSQDVEKSKQDFGKSVGDPGFLLFHKGGSNDYIYATRTTGNHNGGMQGIYRLPNNFRTEDTPESITVGGQVFLYWRGESDEDVYMSYTSCDDAIGSGSNWAPVQKVVDIDSGANPSAPEVVFYKNQFYIFWAYLGEIFFKQSSDGINFGMLSKITDYSDPFGNSISSDLTNIRSYKMAATVSGNNLYLFFVGSGNQIKYLTTDANVVTATDWKSFQQATQTDVGESTVAGIDVVTVYNGDLVLTFTGRSTKRVLTKNLTVGSSPITNAQLNTSQSSRNFGNKYSRYHIGIASDNSIEGNVLYGFKSRDESSSGPVESMLGTNSNSAPTQYSLIPSSGTTKDAGVSVIYVY